MKKILYILFAVVALLSSCVKTDLSSADPNITTKEGEVTMAVDLKIQGAALQAVETRAGETFAGEAKENVTNLRGYAFVFAEDPGEKDKYGDNSKLLQKVAFKSALVGGKALVYITLKEQTAGCFIRLMTCMTDAVYKEMQGFVSQQMVEDGESTAPVTLFKDYKHISVGLDGYYASATAPNPTQLTDNPAFPLASPGIDMPNGISQESVDEVNPKIYMIPVASKVDVTSKCDFTLKEVTLLNGAMRARMRSTVLDNTGTHSIHGLPLPINLGGVVEYAPLKVADGSKTTAATPIYFYPNEGDGPFDDPLDPDEEEYADDDLSNPYNKTNPTYLIIKGQAAGFDTDGYYKLPIRYKFKKADGTVATDYTYDIVRNNHYKVRLISVNNAGYATPEEAADGPANDIVYDIEIDDQTTDDRNELIVSNNGSHYMEVKGSEIYIKARSEASVGVDCSLDFKFVSADNIPEYGHKMPKVYFTADNTNITLDETEIAVLYSESKSYTLNFNVKSAGANESTAGNIIVRWGELYKKIPVNYENKHAVSVAIPSADVSVNGAAIFADAHAIEGTVNDINGAHSGQSDISKFISSNGGVVANTTYNGRNFNGYVYPTDRSKGIRRVLYAQASNFELIDETKGSEALYSTDGSVIQKIVYRSTGTIYTITDGVTNTSGVRNYEVKGDINSSYNGGFSNFNQSKTWGNSKTFSFEADAIGSNQTGSYEAANSHLSNAASLTLTNFADEVKVYKFQIDQYALPYIGAGYTSYDSTNQIYYWYCSNVADCSYIGNDAGDKLGYSPWVYNAHYIAAEQEDGGTWEWQNAPTENGYRGGDGGKRALDHGVFVDKQNPATNQWRFYGVVKNRTNKDPKDEQKKNQAYFDLKLTNTTDEMVRLRIRFRRDDGRNW